MYLLTSHNPYRVNTGSQGGKVYLVAGPATVGSQCIFHHYPAIGGHHGDDRSPIPFGKHLTVYWPTGYRRVALEVVASNIAHFPDRTYSERTVEIDRTDPVKVVSRSGELIIGMLGLCHREGQPVNRRAFRANTRPFYQEVAATVGLSDGPV